MHIAKKTVGWLCFMSLLAGVFCAGYWLFAVIAPFGRGSRVYHWTKDGLDATQRAVFVSTLAKPNVTRVSDYVHGAGRWSGYGSFDWDPLYLWLESRFAGSASRNPTVSELPSSPLIAAVLLDNQGKAVVSYPAALRAQLEPLEFAEYEGEYGSPYLPESEDTASWELSPSWAAAFERVLGQSADKSKIEIERIRNGRQVHVGFLVSISTERDTVVLMPERARIKSPMSADQAFNLAILALLTHVVTLPIWVGLDAGWRGMRRYPWALLVIVTGWIGLLAYLIARLPPQRPCPNCASPVFAKYKRCPVCGVSLAARCPACHTVMKAGWQYCPVCQGVEPQPPEVETARVETAEPVTSIAPVPSAGKVSLLVRVMDAESGSPLPNAGISVLGRPQLEGLTKHDGTFELWRLEEGSYTITAARQGYASAQIQAEVTEGSLRAVEIALRAKPGIVTGRVVDRATLAPLADARVEVDSTRLDRSAATGADGAFTLDDIPPGPYTVCAGAAGFVDQTKLVEVAPGQPAPLDFALERSAELPAPGEGENA